VSQSPNEEKKSETEAERLKRQIDELQAEINRIKRQ
jgi:hypothetical protein